MGHQLFEDDLGWCTTCDMDVIPFRLAMPMPDNEDAMTIAEPFDNRNKDLLYGFNEDSPHQQV